MTRDPITEFRRHVQSASATYRRMDTGQLTGRNSNATADGLDYSVREARAVLTADAWTDEAPLCAYLDSSRGARLAAAWDRVERRHAGLTMERLS